MTEEEKKAQEEAQEQSPVRTETPEVETGGETEEETVVAAPAASGSHWYDNIMKAYETRRKADEDEDRRGRAREAIASIGDTARAIGNLYFTTKYSPNAYDENMSDAVRERMDQAKANRDKERAQWLNYMLNVAGKEQTAAYRHRMADVAEARMRETERKNREDSERRQRELDYKNDMLDLKRDYNSKKLSIDEMNARTRQMATKYKMNKTDINHNLASWEETTEDIYDDKHIKIGTRKRRIVVNPKSGELEIKETVTTDGQQQSGGRLLPKKKDGTQSTKNNQTNSNGSLLPKKK